jgi:hypothetical protein
VDTKDAALDSKRAQSFFVAAIFVGAASPEDTADGPFFEEKAGAAGAAEGEGLAFGSELAQRVFGTAVKGVAVTGVFQRETALLAGGAKRVCRGHVQIPLYTLR